MYTIVTLLHIEYCALFIMLPIHVLTSISVGGVNDNKTGFKSQKHIRTDRFDAY